MRFSLILFAVPMFLSQVCFSGDLVQLSSKDGQSINALIDSFSPEKELVNVRINGKGSPISFDYNLLDDASKQRIIDWNKAYIIGSSLRFDFTRKASDDIKGHHLYEVKITNTSSVDLDNLRIDYAIPYKEVFLVEKDNGGQSSNKKKKPQYKEEATKGVYRNSIDIENLPSRLATVLSTDTIEISHTQTISQGKGKSDKEVTLKNSLGGIYVEIYSGDNLILKKQSKHGVDQLIENYSQG
ncbi:MAG: hypothetical protein AAGH40_00155 [Verrucomicrobiota bacterium]